MAILYISASLTSLCKIILSLRNLSEAHSVEESSTAPQQQNLSLADELSKLAKLKEQGILSETEFTEMKQELMKKMMQNR
jgi:hypothetical protein